MAEVNGDDVKLTELNKVLEDLEERAQELDRRRTSNINSIRWAFSPLIQDVGKPTARGQSAWKACGHQEKDPLKNLLKPVPHYQFIIHC